MYKAAEYMVGGATTIAKHFKVSDLIVGLTIVAIGTSAPEMVVSLSASLQGSGDIAVANIVGSNIYNLGFILGVVAMVSKISISKKILYRDVLTLVFISLLQFWFFLDGVSTRIEGAIILALFFIWFVVVFRSTSAYEVEDEIQEHQLSYTFAQSWIVFLLGLIALVISGHFMVEFATDIARSLGVSEWIIGLTIVGIGTSTPELITSIVAIRKGSAGISIGNLFGSDIFNQGFVLGLASLLVPIYTTGSSSSSGFLFIALYCLFLFVLMWWDKMLSRKEGIIIMTVVTLRFAWEIWKGIF